MDIGVKATVFCGGVAVFSMVDFIRELKRLKKLIKNKMIWVHKLTITDATTPDHLDTFLHVHGLSIKK